MKTFSILMVQGLARLQIFQMIIASVNENILNQISNDLLLMLSSSWLSFLENLNNDDAKPSTNIHCDMPRAQKLSRQGRQPVVDDKKVVFFKT